MNFPVLVVLNGDRIDYDHTQDNGQDIRFVDADEATVLSHEIERWDESGTSYVWVKVPQIDGGSNTDHVWMYYGNPDAPDGQDPEGVWDANYAGVWHLDETVVDEGTTGVHSDSTANDNDGDQNGNDEAPGKIADGQRFDGIDDHIQIIGLLGAPADVTLSGWANLVTTDSGGAEIVSIGDCASMRLDAPDKGAYGFYYNGIDWNSTPSLQYYAGTGWHYVAYIHDDAGGTQTLYVDGIERASTTFTQSIIYTGLGSDTFIGTHGDSKSPFDFNGVIDEVRVATAARSADWITAQYASMTDAFVAFGDAQDVALAVLDLDAWVSRSEVYAGSNLYYGLQISNTGGVARNLVVSDTLPADTSFGGCDCGIASGVLGAPTSPQDMNFCGASFSCGVEGDRVVWRLDDVAGGDLLQMTFWVTIDADLSDGAVIVNDDYAVVADGLTPLEGSEALTTTVRAMLVSISGSAAPNPVSVGQTLHFTVTVRNDGQVLNGITVTDLLPSGVSFLDCGGALCAAVGQEPEVRWWLSTLPAASEQHLTLRVSVDEGVGDTLVNASYGAWVPAISQSVMGAPLVVDVFNPPPPTNYLYLPLVFNATQ